MKQERGCLRKENGRTGAKGRQDGQGRYWREGGQSGGETKGKSRIEREAGDRH